MMLRKKINDFLGLTFFRWKSFSIICVFGEDDDNVVLSLGKNGEIVAMFGNSVVNRKR
jgi:hypothetical protein